MSVCFTAWGQPKGQPRARAVRRGTRAGVYDPGTADGWKSIVVMAGRPHRPDAPIEGPVRVSIDLWFQRPKSMQTRKFPDGMLWHRSKPDRDNCEKAILDALTQDGWWRDDSQVCDGTVRKFYTTKTGRPGALIQIVEMQGDEP